MDTAERIELLLDTLKSMTDADRLEAFDAVKEVYCWNCAHPLGDDGRCWCMRDD